MLTFYFEFIIFLINKEHVVDNHEVVKLQKYLLH